MKKENAVEQINKHFKQLNNGEIVTTAQMYDDYLRLYDETVASCPDQAENLESAVCVYAEISTLLSAIEDSYEVFVLEPELTEIKAYSDRVDKLYDLLKNTLYIGSYQIEDLLMILNGKSAQKLTELGVEVYTVFYDNVAEELRDELAKKL